MSVHMLNEQFKRASYGQIAAHASVSHRKSSHTIVQEDLALSIAKTPNELLAAEMLLNRRYDWRGYGVGHKIADNENQTTFLAHLGERLAGTITLGVDSSQGLAIDGLFKAEVDEYRARTGSQICELTRFAFEHATKGESNLLLASLFHSIFIYGKDSFSCTDLFIEVNPRHRRFYQAMLGFKPIGEMRRNPSVDAPSQLMWISVSEIAKQIAAFRAASSHPSRSLYALFLSEAEEDIVKDRLAVRRQTGAIDRLFERERPASNQILTSSKMHSRRNGVSERVCPEGRPLAHVF